MIFADYKPERLPNTIQDRDSRSEVDRVVRFSKKSYRQRFSRVFAKRLAMIGESRRFPLSKSLIIFCQKTQLFRNLCLGQHSAIRRASSQKIANLVAIGIQLRKNGFFNDHRFQWSQN